MGSIKVTANKLPGKWSESIVIGDDKFCDFVEAIVLQEKECKGRYPTLAFDGFPGVEWSVISMLEKRLREKNLPVEIVDGFCFLQAPRLYMEDNSSICRFGSTLWENI
jgi:hypothetical protein